MGVLSRVLTGCKRVFKKNRLAALCSLTLINSITYAYTNCPNLTISSVCLNGSWHVNINPKGSYWEIMGESVNGKPCAHDGSANDVRWNYAFSSARMGLVGCNYSLFDNELSQIGLIQIKSTEYIRMGTNWEKESYPGNWTCHESQETCLFSSR